MRRGRQAGRQNYALTDRELHSWHSLATPMLLTSEKRLVDGLMLPIVIVRWERYGDTLRGNIFVSDGGCVQNVCLPIRGWYNDTSSAACFKLRRMTGKFMNREMRGTNRWWPFNGCNPTFAWIDWRLWRRTQVVAVLRTQLRIWDFPDITQYCKLHRDDAACWEKTRHMHLKFWSGNLKDERHLKNGGVIRIRMTESMVWSHRSIVIWIRWGQDALKCL